MNKIFSYVPKSTLLLLAIVFGMAFAQAQQLSKDDFDAFSGEPLESKYGQVSAIKMVYDLQTKRLHFLDAKHYKYHHEYCRFKLNYNATLQEFNDNNYSADGNRRFLLANINYFRASHKYVLEIATVDLMSFEYISELYSIAVNGTFIGNNLYFLINSPRLQSASNQFLELVRPITSSEIYQNQKYQAISKSSTCGTLKFIHQLSSGKVKIASTDIIVLKETPLFLPEVAGVMVSEFQTPLSHLTILGQNRQIPIAAYKEAFIDTSLLSLNGQNVCYTVANDEFIIEPAEELDAVEAKQKVKKLKFDLKIDSLVKIENLKRRAYKYGGNKASNFAHLYRISKKADFRVPESAFVIPFYFYNEHVISSGADILIEKLLLDANATNNTDTLRKGLKSIQKAIKSTELDSLLLVSVNKHVSNSHFRNFRFRSSTNAEDAKGFSGAGLYTSKTGIVNDSIKTFEKAIKKVWASLWSFEAFSERAYYNINHRDVFMGILVHRSFPAEAVNGVAITKNLYRPYNYGFVVNAQIGNYNVVQPEQGVVNDQIICYPDNADNIYKEKITIDIITQSNMNDNELVMTSEEIQNLANQLELVKQYFNRRDATTKAYLDYGLDIEFKLDGANRQLYLKQVRYFND